MARKTKEELNDLMKKEGIDRIWSWSRFNAFKNSMYEYYLKYIKNVPEDRQDSIYVVTGGLAHDCLEKYYTNEIPYGDMKKTFEDGWDVAFDIAELKFDRSDKTRNKSISEKYKYDLKHFFENHIPLNGNIQIEQFVKAKIGENLFQGYIDCCFKDKNGIYHILDWKTSSQYKGKKAEKECGQLVIYAIALNQMGVPFDKIKIGWCFLKYVTVQYEQANGEIKERDIERFEIGEKMKANVKTWLNKYGYKDVADQYLNEMAEKNTLDVLPPEIRAKYDIKDCFVELDVTNELVEKWTDDIISTIDDILLREKDYKETGSDKVFWEEQEQVKEQSYYFANLCAYSANLHLPYKQYIESFEAADDVFYNVGTSAGNIKSNTDTEDDMSWLNDI